MVVLGSTLYATTLLIASTLLPQMQGTMSATQDEIAWAMTFNILATAVDDADDRLAGGALRPARDHDLVGVLLHRHHLDVRRGRVAGDAGALAHPAGCARARR